MAGKQFTLVVVRHGEATHNLDTFQMKDIVLTNESDRPIMNSPLTELGHQQARLVARRLADTKFHLGFASDLVRAWETAQAIVDANSSLDNVEECRFLRENAMPAFLKEAQQPKPNTQWRLPLRIEIY